MNFRLVVDREEEGGGGEKQNLSILHTDRSAATVRVSRG